MASSEEEGEIGPEFVTNYHFVNNKEEPISFTILPLYGSAREIPDGSKVQVFLRGTVDNGLHKIYKQVFAWKFDLSYVQPEILVLSKNKNWITLQSPRKSFENIIRTSLITVYCLHFVKKNPEASEESIWNHIVKSFSSYEIKPSVNDLVDHIPLIREAVNSDKDLEKSEYLCNILLEKPWKNEIINEDVQASRKPNFIVDVDEDDGDEDGDEEFDDLFDHVCAICDNGGELLSCEGSCMRSFHATIESGAESICESLGLSNAQVETMPNFLCKNCHSKRHQCYLCGKLGSSDKSSGAEVFSCVSGTCGHFYHPECVAKKLHPEDEVLAKVLQSEIAAGESFTCPLHKCYLCKQLEVKKDHELQFAICRRCPKAYHRKCLPKRISFGCEDDKSSTQRAWEGLLPDRILMYCLDHKIIAELGTPVRNHVVFPDMELKMKKRALLMLSSQGRDLEKKRSAVSENFPAEATGVKMSKQVIKNGDSTKTFERKFCMQGFAVRKKPIISGLTSKLLNDKKSGLVKPYKSTTGEAASSKVESNSLLDARSSPVKSAKPAMRTSSCSQPVDIDLEKRMMALIKKTNALFDEEKFRSKFKVASTHSSNPKNALDKITQGKVDASVKAIRAALKKLEAGGSVEDAKAVCEPHYLKQIMSWKKKLQVYLAPAIHGPRYTSFGRHFTKVEKLEEIVNRLHWYVQSGDMVVDFCCGANDFSLLMNKKINKMGKRCSFKNYDLIQPKNDFCFEKRDWMTTHPEELPSGSHLIMGLNPPFGVHAALANKFIDKALQFKPKLLILIVPEETKRLDEKRVPYDLIWKDDRILSGKSFYLPGSLDVHDKQLEQWNVNTPPLYLWSHPDWTVRHRRIAIEHGHSLNEQERIHATRNGAKTIVSNYLMEENHDCYGDFSNLVHGVGDISQILDDVPEDNDESGLIETINPPAKKKKCASASDDSRKNMIEMQCDEPQQKGQPNTSLQGGLNAEKHPKSNGIDMEISSLANSLLNCNNQQGLTLNVGGDACASDDSRENMIEVQCDEKQQKAQSETSPQGELDEEESDDTEMELSSSANSLLNCNNHQGLTRNLQPSSVVHDSKFGTEYSGNSNLNHIENRHNLMNEEASSTEIVHEFSSRGDDISPYQYPLFHQYDSLFHAPCSYPGSAVDNAAYGYPGSAVYNAASCYPGSAVYNAAYGYSSSVAYNAPYAYSGSADYNPMMYTPIGHINSSPSDIRPPGVSTISNYTAPAVVFNATSWAPTEYLDPSMSDLRPPGASTSSNSHCTSTWPRHQ